MPHRVFLFFSLNGARSCSIVGATFCRALLVLLRLLRGNVGTRACRRGSALLARAQEPQTHGSVLNKLGARKRSVVGLLMVVVVGDCGRESPWSAAIVEGGRRCRCGSAK